MMEDIRVQDLSIITSMDLNQMKGEFRTSMVKVPLEQLEGMFEHSMQILMNPKMIYYCQMYPQELCLVQTIKSGR